MLPSSVRAADGVDDEVDAAAVGELAHPLRHVLGCVVDAVVHAVLGEPAEALVARRRGDDDAGAGGLGELDGGEADATGAGLHEHRLVAMQVAELEQAVVGRAELDRHAGRLLDRQPVGDRVRRARRHRHQLGVAAVAHRRDDRLADGEALDPRPDLADDPGGLVADDVRAGGHHAAGAVEEVAALDAHRLDLDEQPAGPHLGIGHVDVLEDLGPSGVGVGSRFHAQSVRTRGCHASEPATGRDDARHRHPRYVAPDDVVQAVDASITRSKRRRLSAAPSRRTSAGSMSRSRSTLA